ncbi:MAG: acylphosphatase [Candidatus Krumholzibacteriia bacterium]
MAERLEIRVSGRVQGVGFRWHTRERAVALGLVGWARNRPDGTVRIVAEGPRDRLEQFLSWVREGPAHARVEHAEPTWSAATGDTDGFRITG